MNKKVLCHFCKKPIHISHWGGVANFGKKEVWFCDNICCLVEFNMLKEKNENRKQS